MAGEDLEQFEQFGTIALIGLVLAPGLAWILRGKSTAAVLQRAVVVSTLLAGAVVIEAAMDRTANTMVNGRTEA